MSPRDQPSSLNSCTSQVPPCSTKTLFFKNNFFLQAPSVAFATVHDRGHGYSNRCTLCRGCALYPHQTVIPPCLPRPVIRPYAGVRITRSKLSTMSALVKRTPDRFIPPGTVCSSRPLVSLGTPHRHGRGPNVIVRLRVPQLVYCLIQTTTRLRGLHPYRI